MKILFSKRCFYERKVLALLKLLFLPTNLYLQVIKTVFLVINSEWDIRFNAKIILNSWRNLLFALSKVDKNSMIRNQYHTGQCLRRIH